MIRPLMALIGAGVLSLAMGSAMAQENGPVVRVVGEGMATREPDRAVVTVGASAQADTAQAAQDEVNKALDATLNSLKQLQVEAMKLQTAGVSLSPVYAQRDRNSMNDEPKVIGYRASNSVVATFDDVTRVGEVLDAAVKSGANEMRGVSFQLKDDSEARREALKGAVEQAKQKGDAIADAAGLKLGPIVEIQEMGAADPMPKYGMMARGVAMEASMAPTPIETGEIQVRASVTVVYRLSH